MFLFDTDPTYEIALCSRVSALLFLTCTQGMSAHPGMNLNLLESSHEDTGSDKA